MLSKAILSAIQHKLTAGFNEWYDHNVILIETVTQPGTAHTNTVYGLYIVKQESYKSLLVPDRGQELLSWLSIMLPVTIVARIVYVPDEQFAPAASAYALGGGQAAYEYLQAVGAIDV